MQKTSQYGAYSGPGGPDTHRPDEQRFSSAGSGETAFHAPHPEPLIALGPLFHILWQRKGLIGLVSLVFLALAFLYVALTPPTYTAQGVIVIDPRQNRILNSQGVLSGIGANSAAISSQVEIIQSRNLLEKVFEDNDLINDPEFSQPRLLSRLTGIIRPQPAPTREQIFKNFASRVTVERQGLTYILTISFKSVDREKAAHIVNAIITRYLASQVDEKSSANADVSRTLSAQEQDLRDELSAAESAIEQFKNSHGILNVSGGRTLLQNQIEQLSAQLVAARERARTASTRYQQTADLNPDTAPLTRLFELLTSTSAAQLRADYNRAAANLSSLQASLGPRHPNLLVAEAELNRLQGLVRTEARSILSGIENEKDQAETNVTRAEQALADLSRQNEQASRSEVELRQLERQADAIRQVLEQTINRAKETGQLENLQNSDARIISRAAPPVAATWPKPALILPFAAFFGLALGSAIALYLGPKSHAGRTRNAPPPQPAYAPASVAAHTFPVAPAPMADPPAAACSIHGAPAHASHSTTERPPVSPAPISPAPTSPATMHTHPHAQSFDAAPHSTSPTSPNWSERHSQVGEQEEDRGFVSDLKRRLNRNART